MEKGHPEVYGQRVTDVAVVETGKSLGIKTYIVVPPTICMLEKCPSLKSNIMLTLDRRKGIRSICDPESTGPKSCTFGPEAWIRGSD
jgi:hypothetical protein